MSYSLFIVILQRDLKAYFEQKQQKQIVQKIFEKKNSAFTILLRCCSLHFLEKNNSQRQCCWCRAYKVGKEISFRPNFNPHSLNIPTALKNNLLEKTL